MGSGTHSYSPLTYTPNAVITSNMTFRLVFHTMTKQCNHLPKMFNMCSNMRISVMLLKVPFGKGELEVIGHCPGNPPYQTVLLEAHSSLLSFVGKNTTSTDTHSSLPKVSYHRERCTATMGKETKSEIK